MTEDAKPAEAKPAEAKPADAKRATRKRTILIIAGAALAGAVAAALVAALLVNISERKHEGENPFFRAVDLGEDSVDPAIWGKNFPNQYDAYRRTVDQVRTRYGGSEAVP